MHPSVPPILFQQLDDAVSEVFTLMLSRPCIPAPPCLKPAPGFTALVEFAGSLNGACTIHLDLISAGELTEQLIGEPPPPGSPLPADAVGELCNMIAGSWKSRLAPHLAACHLSSPIIQTTDAGPPCPTPITVTRSYRFPPHCLTLHLTLA